MFGVPLILAEILEWTGHWDCHPSPAATAGRCVEPARGARGP
jgi:hypothetical protein